MAGQEVECTRLWRRAFGGGCGSSLGIRNQLPTHLTARVLHLSDGPLLLLSMFESNCSHLSRVNLKSKVVCPRALLLFQLRLVT